MKPEKARREDDALAPACKDENSENDKHPPVSNYWRILSFGTRLEHGLLFIAICSAASSGVALPLMNIVFGHLVGDFNGYFIPDSGVTEGQFKASVSRNALYFVYLFIGKFVLTYLGWLCFRTAGLRISAALRLSYLQALFSQPVKKLDEISTGTVANTITTASNIVQLSISDMLSHLLQSLALVVAAFAIAFKYSWALTLATSSGILFVGVVYGISNPFVLKAFNRVDKADEKHATVSSEAISSIRTVFALGAESKMIERHTRWVDESHRQGVKIAKWIGFQLAPMYFAIYACYALAFWFGLKLYREGHIQNVGTVIVVFFSVLLVTAAGARMVTPLIQIQKAISASTPFFEIMDAEPIDSSGIKSPDISAHHDIELRDITFAYPTRPGVKVLTKFNANFRKGKTTALVGPSGSGKSTIVALLERWYDLHEVQAQASRSETAAEAQKGIKLVGITAEAAKEAVANGSIIVGGRNVNEFDLRWWRTQIGLVQQEPFLFNDTIENNVAYGLIGTAWEHADAAKKAELVKEACKEAFADEFISKMPKGYSTVVGEGGIKLSGGQRQRIAIARSIVRQPAILILDEATSAIDVRAEKNVQEALDRASRNRTTIIIAHRLSTIRKADHIIVLRAGQKVEEGTHEELLAAPDGLYQSLVNAQKIENEETSSDTSSQIGADDLEPTMSRVSKIQSRTLSFADAKDVQTAVTDEEKAISPTGYRKKGFFKSVGLLLYEQRARWPICGMAILGAIGCGAAYALQSWFFAQLVQTFQYTGQRLVNAANFWALMFFVLSLAVGLSYFTLGVSAGLVSAHTGTYCRKICFMNILQMPITYFDREENASGTVMQRLSSDPKQIQELLGVNGAIPLISIFNILGCIIISFYFGWKLTLVIFFAVTPVIIGASFVRVRHDFQFEKTNAEVFAKSSQFATEAIGAFRTVSSLAMEELVVEKYRKLLDEQVKTSTRRASYAMLIYAFTDCVELCGMALTFWYGGQLLASRKYQPIQFFVIYSAIVQGAQAAGQYLSITPNLAYATASANRILELRGRVKEHVLEPSHSPASKPELGARIEFKEVNFEYPGVSAPLFSQLNINIESGQFVAFVGPSGCGKTTIISLLERFYDAVSGTVKFDDNDIASLDVQTYRRDLALVSQEPRLFSGTIRQNLLFGVDESSVTDVEIEQACRDAEIHDFIISLPDGYATELGQNTQTALSGGQKQRVCLARALLRRPKLLLLDEATSSLDSQSEKLVQGAIERLAGQRSMTVIAVAHRLATIQKADVIFVFGERDIEGKKGSKIVERGTHSELLAKRGVYWSMCQAQALDK